MSQRLIGLSHEDATGTAKMVFEGSDQFLGRTANLQRILAKHSPYIARWFGGLVASVRQPGLGATTEARLRGLASIKTSMLNACDYCMSHTSMYGRGLGMSDEEIEAIADGSYKTNDKFSARDRAVLDWTEAMTLNKAQRDPHAWKAMSDNFTETEIVEISMTCAMFNMINRLNDSFWTDLESLEHNKLQWNAVKGHTIEDIEAFAGKFAAVGAAERAAKAAE